MGDGFGVGEYGNPTPGFVLENAGPGDSVPVNPSWLEVVRYGWQKGLKAGIFETVGRDFARDKVDWKVKRSDGSLWTWGSPPQPVNCWANREYVKWRLDVTNQAIRDYQLYMVAWDSIVPADWSWLGWPDVDTRFFATNHGHLPGDVRYAIYRNIVWFLAELQRLHPRLAMRVAPLPGHSGPHGNILIPGRTLAELARILPSEGVVQMVVTPNRSQVLFHSEHIDLVSRLIVALMRR